MLLAGELLRIAKTFIEEGMHSQVIIKGFKRAMSEAVQRIKHISVKLKDKDKEEKRIELWFHLILNL